LPESDEVFFAALVLYRHLLNNSRYIMAKLWLESSLQELYQNTVAAFPNTTKRQHAIDPITISSLQWIPFLGMKTLFVKGLAESNHKAYAPIVVFKQVNYHEEAQPNTVSLMASDGKAYILDRFSIKNTNVLLKCACNDFNFRFRHYNFLDKSLYGRNRKKYEGADLWEANPQHLPGMCKHLIKLAAILKESGIVA